LRKLQQEMDSLTFRNLQLAKRVELLQDELALSEPRGKKNKVSIVASPVCGVRCALRSGAAGFTQRPLGALALQCPLLPASGTCVQRAGARC
jgi:hypothetical protein